MKKIYMYESNFRYMYCKHFAYWDDIPFWCEKKDWFCVKKWEWNGKFSFRVLSKSQLLCFLVEMINTSSNIFKSNHNILVKVEFLLQKWMKKN